MGKGDLAQCQFRGAIHPTLLPLFLELMATVATWRDAHTRVELERTVADMKKMRVKFFTRFFAWYPEYYGLNIHFSDTGLVFTQPHLGHPVEYGLLRLLIERQHPKQ